MASLQFTFSSILDSYVKFIIFVSDPDYSHLSLGTVSSLLEIGILRRISMLKYYYLGYYLANCPKLAYKARFKPSEILDPNSLSWDQLKNTQI